MYKSASAEVVGSSTTHQGTGEEPCPPVHPVITKETSVLAVILQQPMNWPQLLLAVVQETSENSLSYPLDKRAFMEVQVSSREVSAHHWNKKKKLRIWMHWRGVKGIVRLYLHQPCSKVAQLMAKKDLLSIWFLQWQRKGKAYNWASSFPSCVGCCQRGPFHS